RPRRRGNGSGAAQGHRRGPDNSPERTEPAVFGRDESGNVSLKDSLCQKLPAPECKAEIRGGRSSISVAPYRSFPPATPHPGIGPDPSPARPGRLIAGISLFGGICKKPRPPDPLRLLEGNGPGAGPFPAHGAGILPISSDGNSDDSQRSHVYSRASVPAPAVVNPGPPEEQGRPHRAETAL